MDDVGLAFAGIARQLELLEAKEVTSRELVQLYLDRIERIDPALNAYRKVLAERALAEADQADARRAGGEERPLLGIPIAMKDNFDVAGEVNTNGTAAHGGPAAADAELTRRLREAGAVLIGLTRLPELAIMGCTESLTGGVTRNPWDLERTPGGSSGGSGAAVAAGLATAATASDGAGSIRIPAACCGLFGLKPQRGRVSLMPYPEHWLGMSVAGCLTRTVLDTALFLDAVAGPAPGDREPAAPPPRPFAEAARARPERLRIAVSAKSSLPVPAHASVRGALEETAELLRSLGHTVSEVAPAYGDIGSSFMPRYLGGIAEDAAAIAHPERLQRRTRGFARMGRLLPAGLLERVRRDEARHLERVNRVFADHDVVLTPTIARPPVRAAEWEGCTAVRTVLGMMRAYPYTATWNATGQPAASVPAGLDEHGLPLAVQLVGRPSDEGTLLSLAAELEAERPWADRRPALAAS